MRPKETIQAFDPWIEEQDGNKQWPVHVRATLDDLQRRLGHAL